MKDSEHSQYRTKEMLVFPLVVKQLNSGWRTHGLRSQTQINPGQRRASRHCLTCWTWCQSLPGRMRLPSLLSDLHLPDGGELQGDPGVPGVSHGQAGPSVSAAQPVTPWRRGVHAIQNIFSLGPVEIFMIGQQNNITGLLINHTLSRN